MPRRPPKEWFRKTVRSLKKVKGVVNPQALAGWIWFHHMKSATKKAVLKAKEKVKRRRR